MLKKPIFNKKVLCACGCGKLMDEYDKYNIVRRYINGHNKGFRKFSGKDLKELYINKKMSSCKIAKIFKCSDENILHWLHIFNIPVRTSQKGVKREPRDKKIKKKISLSLKGKYKEIKSPKYNKIEIKCAYCSKQKMINQHELKTFKYHFCNRECFKKWHKKNGFALKGKDSPSWKGGLSFELYPEEFFEIRNYIRARDNYTCQFPSCDKKQNGKAFDTHHIDYNKRNCIALNLITLCRKHNSVVNKNREYWTEYFQNKLIKRGITQ